MNTLLTTFSMTTLILLSSSAFAGGISRGEPNATVICSGEGAEIQFSVKKSDYKGELLHLSHNNDGSITFTNKKLSAALEAKGFLDVSAWDRELFLKSINADPKKFKDHVALSVSKMEAINLYGGTLKTQLTLKSPISLSEKFSYKTAFPLKQTVTHIKVEQLDDQAYSVSFKRIEAGQKVCVREEVLPNPYFIPGSEDGGSPTFIGCVEYKDISEQKVLAEVVTKFSINQCELLK